MARREVKFESQERRMANVLKVKPTRFAKPRASTLTQWLKKPSPSASRT